MFMDNHGFQLTRNISRPDPANDKEVMEGIDAFYFLEDGFDAVDHEFKVTESLISKKLR